MALKCNLSYDPYEALGLTFGATPREVKKAYRDLARVHHPDKVGENNKEAAEAAFHKIKEASDFLLNPEKKEKFDREGKARLERQKNEEKKRSQASAIRKRFIDQLHSAEKKADSKKNHESPENDYTVHIKRYRASMNSFQEKIRTQYQNVAKKTKAAPQAPSIPDIDLEAFEKDVLGDLL